MNLFKKIAGLAATGVALFATSMVANAGPIYSLDYQGVTFAIEGVDDTSFKLTIENADQATGNWTGAEFLRAFMIKDIGDDFTGATISPNNFTFSARQLSANGCGGKKTNDKWLCFTGGEALTSIMSWTITVQGALLNFAATGPHLMVNFVKDLDDGKALGSVLSQRLPVYVNEVPEPATLGLLGLGLAGIGFAVRRRKA